MSVRGSQRLRTLALDIIEPAFQELEKMVPPPRRANIATGYAQRFQEKTPEQALIQKLARYCSGLKAIETLLTAKLFQEQGVIQRTIDEIGEDIVFICLGIANGGLSDIHKRYLDAFWAEEFDHPEVIKSTLKREMVPRKKIRAYINRVQSLKDPSTADAVLRTLHSAYSGYVHASSPQIMDMYRGRPPRFQIYGSDDSYLLISHSEDAWNYFYRGLIHVTMIAKIFGNAELVALLYKKIDLFEQASGE